VERRRIDNEIELSGAYPTLADTSRKLAPRMSGAKQRGSSSKQSIRSAIMRFPYYAHSLALPLQYRVARLISIRSRCLLLLAVVQIGSRSAAAIRRTSDSPRRFHTYNSPLLTTLLAAGHHHRDPVVPGPQGGCRKRGSRQVGKDRSGGARLPRDGVAKLLRLDGSAGNAARKVPRQPQTGDL